MEKRELIVKDKYNIEKSTEMVSMAKALKLHIVKHGLYTTIVNKNYAHVEGWQFAGGLLGIFPRVVCVENLSSGNERKWKADVELVDRASGSVIGRGFAICSNLEAKKKSFDEYAVLSMAQTRAIGKAYRNIIGWVMKLAGYEATPSEDMFKMGENVPAPKKVSDEITGFECFECAKVITKAESEYSKKMFGKPLCREHQKGAKRK